MAFSRLLGEVVPPRHGSVKGHPEVQAITRDASRSKMAAYREATFWRHFDGSTDTVPDKYTLLTAREVSGDDDGDTEFANTYAAYESLADEERADLASVRVVHSFAASQLNVYPEPLSGGAGGLGPQSSPGTPAGLEPAEWPPVAAARLHGGRGRRRLQRGGAGPCSTACWNERLGPSLWYATPGAALRRGLQPADASHVDRRRRGHRLGTRPDQAQRDTRAGARGPVNAWRRPSRGPRAFSRSSAYPGTKGGSQQ